MIWPRDTSLRDSPGVTKEHSRANKSQHARAFHRSTRIRSSGSVDRNSSVARQHLEILIRNRKEMSKRLNTCRMSDETMVKFIELYRSHNCLWDNTSENYKSMETRKAAYKSISKEIGIPGFGPREVTKKIQYLRTVYYQEVRKIENSKKKYGSDKEKIYKPKIIWFDLLDDFLRSIVKRKLRNPEQKPKSPDSKILFQGDQRAEQICISDTRAVSTEKGVNVNLSRLDFPETRNPRSCDENLTKRKKLISHMIERSRRSRGSCYESDVHESFGRYVATSLRKMPFECSISAESEIHAVIIKYKVYAMKKQSFSASSPSTSSSFRKMREESAHSIPARTSTVSANPAPSSSFTTTRRSPPPSTFVDVGSPSASSEISDSKDDS